MGPCPPGASHSKRIPRNSSVGEVVDGRVSGHDDTVGEPLDQLQHAGGEGWAEFRRRCTGVEEHVGVVSLRCLLLVG